MTCSPLEKMTGPLIGSALGILRHGKQCAPSTIHPVFYSLWWCGPIPWFCQDSKYLWVVLKELVVDSLEAGEILLAAVGCLASNMQSENIRHEAISVEVLFV